MAQDTSISNSWKILRRFLVGILFVLLLGLFLLSRIDNPRAERFRMALVDRFFPSFEWALVPVTTATRMVADFQSYTRVYEQNQELRRELQRMKGWREAALQLEQKNAQLLALNNVKLNPRLAFITGEVMTDSGSPFSQSALVNIGRQDGVRDGSAAVDGLGLVGRIAGVGEVTSRILFLSDVSSSVPVIIMPSGRRAIVRGDNSIVPPLDFLDSEVGVQAGSRVMTSGDGGVFPSDILIGQVAIDPQGHFRVRLAADHENLEFIRVLKVTPREDIGGPGDIIGIAIGASE
ncbi:rod shape-determining protein MreC [Rhodobacterales bacterium 52_120_T64]|nr:rod shape-determining protein MreC [Rhodobacterales bacterium 52_120_T64]